MAQVTVDRAYIGLGESTDLGVGATAPEKGWVPLFHRFLESSFFRSSADLHNYSVTGATAGDILQRGPMRTLLKYSHYLVRPGLS